MEMSYVNDIVIGSSFESSAHFERQAYFDKM